MPYRPPLFYFFLFTSDLHFCIPIRHLSVGIIMEKGQQSVDLSLRYSTVFIFVFCVAISYFPRQLNYKTSVLSCLPSPNIECTRSHSVVHTRVWSKGCFNGWFICCVKKQRLPSCASLLWTFIFTVYLSAGTFQSYLKAVDTIGNYSK